LLQGLPLATNAKTKKNLYQWLKKYENLLKVFVIEDLFPSTTWLQHATGVRPMIHRLHQQVAGLLGKHH